MLVIVCAKDSRLISCHQDARTAWKFAHALAWKSGVYHWVGRVQHSSLSFIHSFGGIAGAAGGGAPAGLQGGAENI